jgi:chemotaxis protein CheY-P-specific phosphatase CheC
MARAAHSLRQMVEYQVMLSVPSVEIVSKEAATELLGKSKTRGLWQFVKILPVHFRSRAFDFP